MKKRIQAAAQLCAVCLAAVIALSTAAGCRPDDPQTVESSSENSAQVSESAGTAGESPAGSDTEQSSGFNKKLRVRDKLNKGESSDDDLFKPLQPQSSVQQSSAQQSSEPQSSVQQPSESQPEPSSRDESSVPETPSGNNSGDPNDISFWNNVRVFSGKSEFADYYRRCTVNRESVIYAQFASDAMPFAQELGDATLTAIPSIYSYNFFDSYTRLEIKLTYLPGVKVSDAYLSGDTSKLNAREKEVYRVATQVADNAKREPTPMRRELYIHDYLVNTITYYTTDFTLDPSDLPEFYTAIGAMMNGKANCQGYTDAFYMLGRMCGLNVDSVGGFAWNREGYGGHAINTIEYDGKIYYVDVTWDDLEVNGVQHPQYVYFNASYGLIGQDHFWSEWVTPPDSAMELDSNYYFMTPEKDATHFGVTKNDTQSAAEWLVNDKITNGISEQEIMIPSRGDAGNFGSDLSNAVRSAGLNCSTSYYRIDMGRYIYYIVMFSD